MYVVANIACGLYWTEYSFKDQAISELSAIDAPSRAMWIGFGSAYDLLLLAFGIGVWRAAGNRRGLRASAVALLAVAMIGAYWPPMHMRGETTTLTDTLHVAWAAGISVLIFVAIGASLRSLGTAFRNFSIAMIGLMLVFGTLTFALASDPAKNLPTPWFGVVERLNLGAYLLWVAVLAIALWREADRKEEGHAYPGHGPLPST